MQRNAQTKQSKLTRTCFRILTNVNEVYLINAYLAGLVSSNEISSGGLKETWLTKRNQVKK